MSRALLLVAVAVVLTVSRHSLAVSFYPVATPPLTQVGRLSGDGTTVIGTRSFPGPEIDGEAVRWTLASGWVGLGDLAGGRDLSAAADLSGDGSMVLARGTTTWDEGAPFVWTAAGGGQPLAPIPGIDYAAAREMSHDGSVVVGQGGPGFVATHVLRWTAAGGESLGSIPSENGGTVVFLSDDGDVLLAQQTAYNGSFPELHRAIFRYSDADGWQQTAVPRDFLLSSLSADGSVLIGTRGVDVGPGEAARWTPAGGLEGLGFFPGGPEWSTAFDSTADGSLIIGAAATGIVPCPGSEDPGCTLFTGETFVWSATGGMRTASDFLFEEWGVADVYDWSISLKAISDDGRTLLLHGVNPQGVSDYWIAVVPEPRPGALLAGAVVLLGLGRRLVGSGLSPR